MFPPICLRQSPTGRGHTQHSHIRYRSLIMSLATWVGKTGFPSGCVLSSGARYSLCRHPVAPVRNFVIGECLYKYPRSNRKKLLLIPYRRGDSRISRKYPQCTFITIPYFECKVSSSSFPLILALSTTETVTGVSL